MGKLEHFSHSCPLTSPEIVAYGICNICFKDEPIEFACKPCNFDICKTCSKLPQMVSHSFHSEHSLEFCLFQYDSKPGFIVCSGCGNMSSCSFYECKECEIYLDLGCALLKNIVTAWDVRELLHYSHEHLLRRCRPGLDARGSCLLCELPISPSSICYGCVYCYLFLHERCLDLPTEIHHPVHPKHPLRRLDYIPSGGRTSCAACRNKIESVPFGCLECKFYIHMRCVDSLLRGLKNESHEEHRLFYVASNANEDFGRKSTPCQICMETTVSSLSSYYHCIECDLQFHFECLGIPEFMFKRSCHVHPLVCKKFSEETDFLEYCGVCETLVYAGHHVYSCEECDFLGHIECILREEEPLPLYLKDLYSCGEDVTRATNQEDYETNKLENKLMVNDIDHHHVMTAIEISEVDCKEDCGICEKEILSNPWKCETCSFVTHNFCVELGKPSRHRCHWKHLLTLLPKPISTDTMSCNSCREDIKGFNLFCRICDFAVHVSCAMKGKRFLGMLGSKVVGTWRGRCIKGKHRMVQVMLSRSYQIDCVICHERVFGKAVSCLECKTVYHLRCIDQHRSKNMIVDRKQ